MRKAVQTSRSKILSLKTKGRPLDGVFLLDKAPGVSSNKALQQLKRLYMAEKAGHTGALDPLATGLLPICFGEATKFSQYLLDADKEYFTTAKLGIRTRTSDADGEVVEEKPVPMDLTSAQIEDLLRRHFLGEIEQVPSMYSALKHQGQPLYKLARKGIEVEVKPRRVQIYEIELLALRADEIDLRVFCSKGTYIRSIVEDLGMLLGCGAHVQRLHRIRTGQYHAAQMRSLEALEAELQALPDDPQCIQNHLDQLLLPPWSAIAELPELRLEEEAAAFILQGRRLRLDEGVAPSQEWRLFAQATGAFLGLGETNEAGILKGKRLIRSA